MIIWDRISYNLAISTDRRFVVSFDTDGCLDGASDWDLCDLRADTESSYVASFGELEQAQAAAQAILSEEAAEHEQTGDTLTLLLRGDSGH